MAMHAGDDCNDFLPWLEGKTGAKVCEALSIGRSIYGRAVYATENIGRGACLLRVPYSVQLSSSNLPPEMDSLLELSDVAKVALLVLQEKKLGRNSELAPYINCLPLPEDMHSTIFWSDNELEMIRPSALYEETTENKELIEKDFLAVRQVFDRFPDRFQDVTLEEFMYSHALVKSRSWESRRRGLSIITFADFMNHDANSGAKAVDDDVNAYSWVIADRDFAPGEEVLVRYAEYPNRTFTVSDNRYDVFNVDLNVPEDDALYRQKEDLLKLQLLFTPWNSFTISEVEGKGIPEAFRAFARVLDCKTKQELNELQNPSRDKNREIAAHQLLLFKISLTIEEHNKCMEKLESTQPNVSEKSVLRMEFARDVLMGELRVSRSASDWLERLERDSSDR